MTIKLDGNDLGSLTQLGCLTQLPKLKHLGLKGNKISVAARRSTVKDSQGYFNKALSEVDLSQNLVSDWSFVNQLSQVFPGLVSLRLSSNPLYRDLKDAEGAKLDVNDAFMLTAARLAILQMLNYSKVNRPFFEH